MKVKIYKQKKSLVQHPFRAIGTMIEVHKILGPGFLESIYVPCELKLRNIEFKRQLLVPVTYKSLTIKKHRMDLVVEDSVIVEIKAIKQLPDIATVQTLSYLKALKYNKALIINFGRKMLIPLPRGFGTMLME